MATISDIIYHLEITDKIDHLDLNESDCIKASSYLINNLNEHHTIPGDVYLKFIGILDWYNEHEFITPKQHYWLMVHLWKHIDQRIYTMMEML
jgi:hypothetical protein